MQKSLKTIRFEAKMHTTPFETARKSTNSKQSTITFLLFFLKIKIEIGIFRGIKLY
jgi:hypothetical protein